MGSVQDTTAGIASADPVRVGEFVGRKGMAAYAAPSLFQPHFAKKALRDAHEGRIPPLLCYYAGLSSVPITRFLAPMGYDACWVDWEHTSCNVETMTTMVHETIFMSGGRTIPFVRVPGHDHAAIGYALDAGASIVVPQVETVEQARHVVSAAKYSAKRKGVPGTRSAPPFRLIPFLTDASADPSRQFHDMVNDQPAIMIQIETLQGIKNLDAILTECAGDIDAVWIGTLDCRISMGLPANYGMGGAEPEWVEALAEYEAVVKKHDVPRAGFALAPKDKLKAAADGRAFLTIAADVVKLAEMEQQLADAREAFA